MNRITFILVLMLACVKLQAQDYQISFAGTGAATTVDSVQVQNLTQGTNVTIGGTDVLHLSFTVDIEQLTAKSENGLRIYPNPMTSNSNIEFEIPKSGSVIVEVFDVIGRKTASVQNNSKAGAQIFNVSNLSYGIYTISIKSGNVSYSGKILSNCSSKGVANITYVNSKSKSGATGHLKCSSTLVQMQYNEGDRLLFKGISNIYSTVLTDIPTINKTETFNFIPATDGDGNNYATVTIGTQTWMAENLKATKYNDGITDIPLVEIDWQATATPAYCWYENNYATYGAVYGALYNWQAVDTASTGNNNICPVGWHIPSDDEWNTLTTYLGGETQAGGPLKETGMTTWLSPNTNATNETGFTALAAGFRWVDGTFGYLGLNEYYWSSTPAGSKAYGRFMFYGNAYCGRNTWYQNYGFSVRCVKD